MKNPLTRNLISTASLLAFASVVAAQNAQSLPQLEGKISTLPQSAGSSISGFLNSARYELGRGLTFTSQDGGNSMTIGGQVQVGYGWGEDFGGNTDRSEFSADARLRFGGDMMDGKASYFVQITPNGGQNQQIFVTEDTYSFNTSGNVVGSGDPVNSSGSVTVEDAIYADDNVVDAWVGWQIQDNLNLRVGRQKMRSGLSADTSANDTDFETVTRSISTAYFAGARATGALIEGSSMEGRLNWHAGVMNQGTSLLFNGLSGAGQSNDDTDMAWTAGVSFGSHAGNSESWSEGDLARSGDMQWIGGATITADNGPDDNASTVNVYGGVKMGNGVAGQVEWWTRDLDDADITDDGGYAQVSYTLAKMGSMQPGFVARWGVVGGDSFVDDATEIVVGANAYYSEHNLKTQVQVRNFDNGTDDAQSVDLLFTIVF